jgi:hypothetical protein
MIKKMCLFRWALRVIKNGILQVVQVQEQKVPES